MKIKVLPIALFFLSFLLLSCSSYIYAEETDADQIEDLQDEIEKYEKKLAELKTEANSLSNEIAEFDSQIKLTQLQIQNTINNIAKKEKDIARLADDIDDLKGRITKLGEAIEYQQSVLNQRIRERYKSRETSPIVVIFGSTTINNLLQKAEYLKVMEEQDNRLIADMNRTKDAFDKQKTIFEEKKSEEESLREELIEEKSNLDYYNAQLAEQRSQKEKLLEVTQNDEAKYQELLNDALKELNQITNAVSALIGQDGEEVEKGDIIGYQGNSGYSFGEHLHFGVYRYSSFEEINGWNWYYSNHVDPAKKLKSKSVYWNDGCSGASYKNIGKGDWAWPISNPTVSQGYGITCWSSIYYGGKPHPAFDMYGSSGTPVFAADSGTAYYCRNCLGDGGNGVFIFHDDDYMTVYWHLR